MSGVLVEYGDGGREEASMKVGGVEPMGNVPGGGDHADGGGRRRIDRGGGVTCVSCGFWVCWPVELEEVEEEMMQRWQSPKGSRQFWQ